MVCQDRFVNGFAYPASMRVFGIDCGTQFTGWGVVETDERARTAQLRRVAGGTIRLEKTQPMGNRLLAIHTALVDEIARWQPDCVAIEEVFFAANAKSALKLGQVRGVALLAAAMCKRPVAEYAPLSIKSAVVGYGLAEKEQVGFMVTRLLRMEEAPDSADAADALAVAICHLQTAGGVGR